MPPSFYGVMFRNFSNNIQGVKIIAGPVATTAGVDLVRHVTCNDAGYCSEYEMLVVDYFLMAALAGVPCFALPTAKAAPSDEWRSIMAKIHWGPLVVHGGVSCMARALQVSPMGSFFFSSLSFEYRPVRCKK